MNHFSLIMVFLASIFLSGCDDDTQDIKAYMEQVQEKTNHYIAPMPEVHPFVHIAYSAEDKRSPFVLPKPEVIEQTL